MGVYLRFMGASVRRICEGLIRDRRPVGLGYLVGFISGTVNSYRYRVDSERRQYLER
jgi:hypothetical protein